MAELLTRDDALRLLTEVVAETGPDFVYAPHDGVGESCTYTTSFGTASCGVGRVIAKVSKGHMDYLHEYEWSRTDAPGGLGADTMPAPWLAADFERHGLSPLFDDAGWIVLARFQYQQDRQTPYGEALLFSRVLEEPVV